MAYSPRTRSAVFMRPALRWGGAGLVVGTLANFSSYWRRNSLFWTEVSDRTRSYRISLPSRWRLLAFDHLPIGTLVSSQRTPEAALVPCKSGHFVPSRPPVSRHSMEMHAGWLTYCTYDWQPSLRQRTDRPLIRASFPRAAFAQYTRSMSHRSCVRDVDCAWNGRANRSST